jgi:hypothetical protein
LPKTIIPPICDANASTAVDDLGVAASGDAVIEGVLENNARIVAAL